MTCFLLTGLVGVSDFAASAGAFTALLSAFTGVLWFVGVAQVSPPSPSEEDELIVLLVGEAGGSGGTLVTVLLLFLLALAAFLFSLTSSSLEIVELHSDATVRLDSGRSAK